MNGFNHHGPDDFDTPHDALDELVNVVVVLSGLDTVVNEPLPDNGDGSQSVNSRDAN